MEKAPRRLLLPFFRISLEFLGEAWKDCWVEFSQMSWAQKKALYERAQALDTETDETLSKAEQRAKDMQADAQAQAEIVTVVQEAFLRGESLDANREVVALEAGDFTHENFTPEAMMRFYNQIIGVPDPKEVTPSPATTPEQAPNPSSTVSSDTESASASQA